MERKIDSILSEYNYLLTDIELYSDDEGTPYDGNYVVYTGPELSDSDLADVNNKLRELSGLIDIYSLKSTDDNGDDIYVIIVLW